MITCDKCGKEVVSAPCFMYGGIPMVIQPFMNVPSKTKIIHCWAHNGNEEIIFCRERSDDMATVSECLLVWDVIDKFPRFMYEM